VSEFEYVVVMVSVVLGLGITQILAGTTLSLQQPERIRADWIHSAWVLYMLLQHFQTWWVIWLFRNDLPSLNLLTFMVLMGNPVLLYLATSVLLPPRLTRRLDLRVHFERVRPWFFALFGASALWALVTFFILTGGRLPGFWPIAVLDLGIPLAGYLLAGRRVHGLLAVLIWLTVVRSLGITLLALRPF
jgi:hypothetical protein